MGILGTLELCIGDWDIGMEWRSRPGASWEMDGGVDGGNSASTRSPLSETSEGVGSAIRFVRNSEILVVVFVEIWELGIERSEAAKELPTLCVETLS